MHYFEWHLLSQIFVSSIVKISWGIKWLWIFLHIMHLFSENLKISAMINNDFCMHIQLALSWSCDKYMIRLFRIMNMVRWGGINMIMVYVIHKPYKYWKACPSTNTKHKSKGEALGKSISLNSVYTPLTHHPNTNF